ncbi:MAG: endonuclease/exonuclease/phosphatase family metal-dependent hydrolase [Rhodothermales bacterium]|jgi:endonuclease/exonuclease/phosphatase family metal-dependent hydrolase
MKGGRRYIPNPRLHRPTTPLVIHRLFRLLGLGLAIGLAGPVTARAQAARIFLEGTFADWIPLSPVHEDGLGDADAGVDFGGLWMANDERYLYLRFELGVETLIQEANQIVLYLDTDDNAATGQSSFGVGAELVWTFGQRTGVFTWAGFSTEIGHAPVQIVTAPTVSSTEFEIAFDLAALPDGLNPLFPGDRIRVVLEDLGSGDILPDASGGVAYTLQDASSLPELPPVPINKARGSDVRVLSYNVERDGVFGNDKNPPFSRLLAAINPDIIGFQEILNHSAADTEALVRAAVPSAPGQTWFSARVSPDLVVVSRYPIIRIFSIPGGNNGDANAAFLLDLTDPWGTELLLVDAHPPCCRNDEARQLDFDAMMAFIRDARDAGGVLDLASETPVIVLGDMNMVGEARQLETLLSGDILNTGAWGPPFAPDWDGSALADLVPPHVSLPMTFTWYNEDSAFHPGRLDFMVYTDSVLEPANNFVLFTPAMPADSLTAHGLLSEDATLASDHLPVVGDFRLKSEGTGIQGSTGGPRSTPVLGAPYPNPFRNAATVPFDLPSASNVRLTLLDLLGREVRVLTEGHVPAGGGQIHFSATGLPPGTYFIRLEGSQVDNVRPILLIR